MNIGISLNEVYHLNSCEIVTTVTALACAIKQCYSDEEIPLLAAVFTQLGDTLATLLVYEEQCKNSTKV